MILKQENDKQGLIPNLHDWEIMVINVNRFNRTAELSLYFPDKKIHSVLRLRGVEKFILSEMKLQNVILDVMCFDKVVDSDYFNHCCRLLGMKVSDFEHKQEMKIIYFEPSVGAEIACSFAELEFNT